MKGAQLVILLTCFLVGTVVSQNCGAGKPACPSGQCCSKYGYCGTGVDYCGGRVCSPACASNECCSAYGYCGTTAEYCAGTGTAGTAASTTSSPSTPAPTSSTTGSSGSCNIGQVFTKSDFTALFPNANGGANNKVANQYAIFTYENLVAAAAYYPTFGCTGDLTTRKREIAAFLAQTSQETSGWWPGQPYVWGYYYSTELGCTNSGCTQYCQSGGAYPCASGKGYFGRGPLQLSWNYNYGAVSQAVFGDSRLVTDPDQILSSGTTAFRTSIWFWMTAQNPKPSAHNVITGLWTPSSSDTSLGRYAGFGMTTNIINGGLECHTPTPQKVINRVEYFKKYSAYLGISPGNNLYCDQMYSY